MAVAITLAAFVGFLAIPQPGGMASLVVMVAGAGVVVLLAMTLMRRRVVSRPVAIIAAASAAGLVGAVFYLNSLADEPTAIPLGGMFVLLVSLVGLIVSGLMLPTTKGPQSSPTP